MTLGDGLLHVLPARRLVLPEVAREAELGKDRDVDAMPLELPAGALDLRLVLLDAGDDRVEVRQADRGERRLVAVGALDDGELSHRRHQPSAAASAAGEGRMSGNRSMRNALSSPSRLARIGTSSATCSDRCVASSLIRTPSSRTGAGWLSSCSSICVVLTTCASSSSLSAICC